MNAKRANAIPGDTEMVMTTGHKSSDGRYWPAGTIFQPRCGGYDNDSGKDYREVCIKGETVVFEVSR